MTTWYVRVEGRNDGPYSLEELTDRGVAPDEYVWNASLADWCRAGNLPELARALRKSPSPDWSQPSTAGPAPPLAKASATASPYASPQADYVAAKPRYQSTRNGALPHSRAGIASTAVAIFATLASMVLFFAIAFTATDDSEDPVTISLALGFCCGGPFLHLIGLALGLFGMFQPDRSRVFGIVGTVLNGLIVLFLLAFIVLATLLAANGP